jgi:hypothetical protein
MDEKQDRIASIGFFWSKNIQLLFREISQKPFFHIGDFLSPMNSLERTGKRKDAKKG